MSRVSRSHDQIVRAKNFRREAMVMEQKLWSALLANKLGVSFERTHTVKPYKLDFYCPSAKLTIELEGGPEADPQARPTARTRFLRNKGIRVLRVHHRELTEDFGGVIASIKSAINATPKPLTYPDEPIPENVTDGEGK